VGAACGDSSKGQDTPARTAPTVAVAAPAAVAIKLFQFQPTQIQGSLGTTVTWTNGDEILHTVTSGTPERPDGRVNGTLDGAGTTFSFTFGDAGTYAYFCARHNAMVGEVRIT